MLTVLSVKELMEKVLGYSNSHMLPYVSLSGISLVQFVEDVSQSLEPGTWIALQKDGIVSYTFQLC